MPIYEYQCRKCGHRLETMQRYSDPPLTECPECAGALKKLISAPAFQFKGSGWYVTDYAGKKGEKKGDGADGKDDGKADSRGEGKADGAESKGSSDTPAGKEKPAAKEPAKKAASSG